MDDGNNRPWSIVNRLSSLQRLLNHGCLHT